MLPEDAPAGGRLPFVGGVIGGHVEQSEVFESDVSVEREVEVGIRIERRSNTSFVILNHVAKCRIGACRAFHGAARRLSRSRKLAPGGKPENRLDLAERL